MFANGRSGSRPLPKFDNMTVPFLLPTDLLPVGDIESNLHHDVGHPSAYDKRWMFLALVALPLWILFGNLLVLLSVIGYRHLRTLSNWVIASLAFTDFLLALTVVPFGIYQLVRFSLNFPFDNKRLAIQYNNCNNFNYFSR